MTIFFGLRTIGMVGLVITIKSAHCYIPNHRPQQRQQLVQRLPKAIKNHPFLCKSRPCRTTTFRSQNHHDEAAVSADKEHHHHHHDNFQPPLQDSWRSRQHRHHEKKNRSSWLLASASIELPFPKQIAYDAFSDLSRQPSFSPWLRSVKYLNDDVQKNDAPPPTDVIPPFTTTSTTTTTTRWTMSYLGLRYSWDAISTLQDRDNGIIEWKSITGLENEGRVEFLPVLSESKEDATTSSIGGGGGGSSACRMTMSMRFRLPRVVTRFIGAGTNERGPARYIETHMLQKTLQNFRDMVHETDRREYVANPHEPKQNQQHPEFVTPFL